jgi:RHS repeat-associated protein
MVDESGAVAWSAKISTYGELRHVEGERNACPFRFQGQYEDAETGLYYNRHRYYDAAGGQYISQDPIGLAGGRALHAYVSDPLQLVDPLGLIPCNQGNASGSGNAPQLAANNLENLSTSQQRSVRSLEQRLFEHREKLDAFKRNPDAFDNKGFLKDAPSPEVRQRIIDGRIRHLENETSNFERQIRALLGGG